MLTNRPGSGLVAVAVSFLLAASILHAEGHRETAAPSEAVTELLRRGLTRGGSTTQPDSKFERSSARMNLQRSVAASEKRRRIPGQDAVLLWQSLLASSAWRVVDTLDIQPELDASVRMRDWELTHVGEQLAAGGFLGSACECFCNEECADTTFCNGEEFCGGGVCFLAAPPTCDDANPCTIDQCDLGADTCSNTPVDPPPEVGNLEVEHPNPMLTDTHFYWDPQAGVSRYNIYRAIMGNLSDLSCFDIVALPGGTDSDPLPVSQLRYYLITSVACGESTLGDDSEGQERINSVPCP